MFKTMALLVVGLVGLCSFSGPAFGIREGGCRTKVVTIKGKLVKKLVPFRTISGPCLLDGDGIIVNPIKPMPMPLPQNRTVWQLEASDKSYTLDLGAGKNMHKLANDLQNKRVIVTGSQIGNHISVTDLKADDSMEVTGKLVKVEYVLERARPCDQIESSWPVRRVVRWQLHVDDRTSYDLTFATPDLAKKAADLVNKKVKVIGKKSGSTLQVSEIEVVARK